jgi:hypothetical protein
MPYLFVHFKEKITPDGEQVYFSISQDGYKWDSVNGGDPILTSTMGEKGCRDIEIVRLHTGGFVILTTDLCIVHRMDEEYKVDWEEITHGGSKFLCMWRTDDLVNFSEQKLINFGFEDFGCLWAPEVFFDEKNEEYLIHWGSTVKETDYNHMSIYCCTTKDFETFSEPKLYFTKDNGILDSHITKIGDTYHLFYKSTTSPSCPAMNMHAVSDNLYGPFKHDDAFEKYMRENLPKAYAYEAATTYTLPDGKWCLMLDFFGCEKEKMGYVPFVSSKPGVAEFERTDDKFTFPYGFKHGRVIEITDEEYERLSSF